MEAPGVWKSRLALKTQVKQRLASWHRRSGACRKRPGLYPKRAHPHLRARPRPGPQRPLYIMSCMSEPPAVPAHSRRHTPLDRLLSQFDQALRTLAAAPHAERPNPATALPEHELTTAERAHAVGLMRVNHAGEVAAQALYHGQAFTASAGQTRTTLLQAAKEEGDHLAWCAERLNELGSRTSLLDPLWYAGSFAIGALAGLAGDRTSLGFVAETERQVEQHLSSHIDRLPPNDERSRAIVQQMKADERQHGQNALHAGGRELPSPIRRLMRATARIMTSTSYWV